MIIDYSQHKGNITVSYCDGGGDIKVGIYNILEHNGFGLYDYEICDEADPEKHPRLRHYLDDKPIKRVRSWRLDFDELREFLIVDLRKELSERIFSFNTPDLYMVDIEIDIKDGDVFPDPNKAEFPIDSIQITSPDLKTIILTANPRSLQDNAQMERVSKIVNDHYRGNRTLKELHGDKPLEYAHMVFASEKELLEYFWKMVRQKLHSVAFWNGDYFDVPYIDNRCKKLGVDMGMGSPTDEISTYNRWAKHRYVFDYMKVVEKYAWDLMPMQSVGLDYISEKAIDANKIGSGKSFKELFFGDIEEYLAYGAVDTINMQLIHQKKKYTSAKESLVFYTKTSMFESTKITSQVHALCWDELYSEGKINAEPYIKKEKIEFEGGYVKAPNRKFVMFPVGIDFSALYPRVMQSYNLSFENYLGRVSDPEKKKQLVEKGYIVTVMGNVYKNDRPYVLKRLETKLLDERYAYKELQSSIYLNAMPHVEAELRRRGL